MAKHRVQEESCVCPPPVTVQCYFKWPMAKSNSVNDLVTGTGNNDIKLLETN